MSVRECFLVIAIAALAGCGSGLESDGLANVVSKPCYDTQQYKCPPDEQRDVTPTNPVSSKAYIDSH